MNLKDKNSNLLEPAAKAVRLPALKWMGSLIIEWAGVIRCVCVCAHIKIFTLFIGGIRRRRPSVKFIRMAVNASCVSI